MCAHTASSTWPQTVELPQESPKFSHNDWKIIYAFLDVLTVLVESTLVPSSFWLDIVAAKVRLSVMRSIVLFYCVRKLFAVGIAVFLVGHFSFKLGWLFQIFFSI